MGRDLERDVFAGSGRGEHSGEGPGPAAPEGPLRDPANTDLIGGILGLVLSALFWFTREQWSFWSAVFPNLTLAVLALLSLALIGKGFVRPERLVLLAEGNRVRILVTAVVLMAWAFALRPVGTLLSSAIAFYALTIYLGSAHRRVSVVDAVKWLVVVTVELGVLYLVFTRVLGVPLPRGVLL
jgi:hypothetical protein